MGQRVKRSAETHCKAEMNDATHDDLTCTPSYAKHGQLYDEAIDKMMKNLLLC